MTILIVVVLLVVAIVVSRLTWASRLGERRSIKHHEQAMDVLRSVAGRPPGFEESEERDHSAAHVKSSVGAGMEFPAPAAARVSAHREETIRIVRPEPSGPGELDAGPPAVAPLSTEPPTVEPPTVEPPTVEPVAAEPTETRPDDLPLEPAAASATNGQLAGDDPAARRSPLPGPPAMEDQYQAPSSRSQARSRSRARTRAMVWARVQAPLLAAARAVTDVVKQARARLAARRGGPGVEERGDALEESASIPDPSRVASLRNTVTSVASVLRDRQAGEPRRATIPRLRRPGLAASVGTIVVVVGVAIGVLIATMSGGGSQKVQQHAQAAASPPSTAKPAPPPPPPPPINLVSSDQTGAVYQAASSHLALSAVASGRVWLDIVAGSGPNGQVLFQGILNGGQSQQITNDAPVWIRIGAPGNVALTVNGAGVLLPSATTPYNLTFSTA